MPNLFQRLRHALTRSSTFAADPGPGFNLWGNILKGSGIRATALKQPYSQHPYASGAIRLAGIMLGGVPFRIVEEDTEANRRMAEALAGGDPEELRRAGEFEALSRAYRPVACSRYHQGIATRPVTETPFRRLFDDGPENVDRSELFSAVVQQILGSAQGRVYLVFRGGVDGMISEGTIPSAVSVWPASAVRRKGEMFELNTEKGWKKYPPHQVCELRTYSPDTNGSDTVLKSAWDYMQSDIAAREWNAEFFANGAEVGNVLSTDQPLTPDAAKEMAERWDENHKQRRKTAVLGRGVQLQATTATQHEMDFVEQFRLNRDAVMACLLVHKAALGVTDDLNRATIEAARKMVWSNLLIPMAAYIESRLYAHLFRRFDDGKRWGIFDISGVPELADDVQTKAEALRTLVDSGVPMNDAVRVSGLDLPLYAWGEEPMAHVAGMAAAVEPAVEGGADEVVEDAAAGLNGAQITAAKDIIGDVIAGVLPPNAALSLLIAVGISEETADKMVKEAKGFKPKAQPKDEDRSDSTRAQHQRRASAWWESVGSQVEAKYQKVVRQMMLDARKEVLKNLDAARGERKIADADIEAMLFDVSRFSQILREGTDHLYQQTLESAYEGIVGELENAGYDAVRTLFNLTDSAVIKYLSEKDTRLAGVVRTVRNEIKDGIVRMVEKNATVKEIADEIRRVSNYQLNPKRTMTIARTETGSASNNVRRIAMAAVGVEYVSWVAASDARDEHKAINDITRDAAARGEPYPYGTDFAPLVGAPGVLRFPHDPQGEAGMVINCRCVIVPEIIDPEDGI
jgi:predicted transcriptional regulator